MKRKKEKEGKHRDKSKSSIDIPHIYKEDIGSQGIKRIRTTTNESTGIVPSLPLTKAEKKRREQRANRFKDHTSSSINSDNTHVRLGRSLSSDRANVTSNVSNPSTSLELASGSFVGQNTNIEKPYFRLTTAPKLQDVRPFHILVKALAHVKRRYANDEDFDFANEQLKSIRQDLTVQRIHSPFVLDVYETHARILLEHGDLAEFNQCQTVLRSLVLGNNIMYLVGEDAVTDTQDPNIHSIQKCKPLPQDPLSVDEFCGYAILYALVQRTNPIEPIHRAIQQAQRLDGETTTAHAIMVVKAVEYCNYDLFFRLYDNAPHMSAFLMDFLLKRVRDTAYQTIVGAYRPCISVEEFKKMLHFRDLEECRRFLKQQKTVFLTEPGKAPFWVDCKQSATIK